MDPCSLKAVVRLAFSEDAEPLAVSPCGGCFFASVGRWRPASGVNSAASYVFDAPARPGVQQAAGAWFAGGSRPRLAFPSGRLSRLPDRVRMRLELPSG